MFHNKLIHYLLLYVALSSVYLSILYIPISLFHFLFWLLVQPHTLQAIVHHFIPAKYPLPSCKHSVHTDKCFTLFALYWSIHSVVMYSHTCSPLCHRLSKIFYRNMSCPPFAIIFCFCLSCSCIKEFFFFFFVVVSIYIDTYAVSIFSKSLAIRLDWFHY